MATALDDEVVEGVGLMIGKEDVELEPEATRLMG